MSQPGRAGAGPAAEHTNEVEGLGQQLTLGEVTLRGRIPWSSNATFLVEVGPAPEHDGSERDGEGPVLAVYKPGPGERPLWDFERGLWRREVAAYELSRHLGWDLVPLTVARHDAPLGEGSLQLFIEADLDAHYFTLMESATHHPQLRRMAAFDIVANNADRKGGHCLLAGDGHIWGIDNGLTFHPEPKLRTVIWDFAGNRIDDALLPGLARLADGDLPAAFAELLGEDEVRAVVRRAAALGHRGRFPRPTRDFPYPWPLI